MVPLRIEEEILFSGTGPHTRPVATNSAKTRQFLNQGLNFMFAFNHGEAKRSFRIAAKYDPNCAMAWWGLAMANGPHINNMEVVPEEEQEAVESLQKAVRTMHRESASNQALIRATLARFKYPQPKDRSPLNQAFAREMGKVWQRFSNDADVGALYAEALMDLWPWNLWSHDGKPRPDTNKIIATLEKVLRLNPKHPLGLHLYIHAVEASPNPERARVAADRLRNLTPGLGHNVHMPSHIDVRLGEWEKAITANAKAIAADKAYRTRRPQQFIYRLYMAHNHHMLAFAAMMVGRSQRAIRQIDTMVAEVPDDFKEQVAPFMDGFFSMPFEVRVRFGRWDEVLNLPDHPEFFPISRAMRHAARSKAYSAKGMPVEAREEQTLFYDARKKLPEGATFGNNAGAAILKVAHHLMNGEILVAEGEYERAIAELRLAVRAEDALNYDEPPDWILPVRHTLGALLVKLERYAEAEQVYREDLKKLPNNGWSLYGLAASLEGQGKRTAAAPIKAQFRKCWVNADIEINTSCLCIPGRDGHRQDEQD